MAEQTTAPKFVDGLWVATTKTQYGEIINVSFLNERFIKYLKDNVNATGYVNIDILTSREGVKYAKLNDYVKPSDNITNANHIDEEIDPSEVPF